MKSHLLRFVLGFIVSYLVIACSTLKNNAYLSNTELESILSIDSLKSNADILWLSEHYSTFTLNKGYGMSHFVPYAPNQITKQPATVTAINNSELTAINFLLKDLRGNKAVKLYKDAACTHQLNDTEVNAIWENTAINWTTAFNNMQIVTVRSLLYYSSEDGQFIVKPEAVGIQKRDDINLALNRKQDCLFWLKVTSLSKPPISNSQWIDMVFTTENIFTSRKGEILKGDNIGYALDSMFISWKQKTENKTLYTPNDTLKPLSIDELKSFMVSVDTIETTNTETFKVTLDTVRSEIQGKYAFEEIGANLYWYWNRKTGKLLCYNKALSFYQGEVDMDGNRLGIRKCIVQRRK